MRHSFGREWTPEEDGVLRAAAAACTSGRLGHKRLAKQLGRSVKAVAMRVRACRLRPGYAQYAAALALCAAGVPYMQVVRLTGITQTRLNRVVREVKGA